MRMLIGICWILCAAWERERWAQVFNQITRSMQINFLMQKKSSTNKQTKCEQLRRIYWEHFAVFNLIEFITYWEHSSLSLDIGTRLCLYFICIQTLPIFAHEKEMVDMGKTELRRHVNAIEMKKFRKKGSEPKMCEGDYSFGCIRYFTLNHLNVWDEHT